jgi:hypothetical protein
MPADRPQKVFCFYFLVYFLARVLFSLYLCIVKKIFFLLLALLPVLTVQAQQSVDSSAGPVGVRQSDGGAVELTAAQSLAAAYDSVEVSLLTCAPHEEVYSLYGHTALRWHDLRTGRDLVFNWGIFNFGKPYFVLRFVFGLTDYELGVNDFEPFAAYYRRWGAMVSEQVLSLTATEKQRLEQRLAENCRPENRVYRYNYFYDNCSTRPRDILEDCIDGQVDYAPRPDFEPSFRAMIRQKTARHEWATEGNDLLLGVRADLRTTRQEQEFLPENLLYDFDHARIHAADGSWRPLVAERRVAVPPGVQVVERDFVLTPLETGLAVLLLSLALFAVEWRRRRTYRWWDALLMSVTGLAGCIIFVMLFSQHPTTSTNLQVLLLNPIHLFYVPAVVRRRPTRYWQILLAMVLLLFVGGLFQHYATLTPFLALCLLLRFVIHLRCDGSTILKKRPS